MSVMNTFSGKKFDPMHMNSEDVSLKDLAHALSLLCRGGGHLKYFYSVGQHSINCMKEARARGWSKRVQLACLLHDASEAYIADIIRPVKAHLPEYYKIESKIMTCIFDKFGLDDRRKRQTRKVTGICPGYDRAKLGRCCREIYNIGRGADKGEISYKNCRNKEVLCI